MLLARMTFPAIKVLTSFFESLKELYQKVVVDSDCMHMIRRIICTVLQWFNQGILWIYLSVILSRYEMLS